MPDPTPRPWAIKPKPTAISASAVTGPDGVLIVTFREPDTTMTLLGGVLTKVLTTLGDQQAILNDVNAKYLVRAVNQFDKTKDILFSIRTMLDPSLNRVLSREQTRKQLFQQVEELIAEMDRPL